MTDERSPAASDLDVASPRVEGSCHCGRVRLKVPHAPGTVTDCHCTVCRRYGALWAYYKVEAVAIEGEVASYSRDPHHIDFLRCPSCGCIVAWRPRTSWPECGVNARLLDGFDSRLASIESEDDASV